MLLLVLLPSDTAALSYICVCSSLPVSLLQSKFELSMLGLKKNVSKSTLSHKLLHVLSTHGTGRRASCDGSLGGKKRKKCEEKNSFWVCGIFWFCCDFSLWLFSSLCYFRNISKLVAQRSCLRCKSSERKLRIGELGEKKKKSQLLGSSPNSLTALLLTRFF